MNYVHKMHLGIFFMVKAPYEEIINFYCMEVFKGTKAMTGGIEAIAFIASVKY